MKPRPKALTKALPGRMAELTGRREFINPTPSMEILTGNTRVKISRAPSKGKWKIQSAGQEPQYRFTYQEALALAKKLSEVQTWQE